MTWLFIMDNLDSEDKSELLRSYWPGNTGGAVLLTSRDSSLIRQFGGVEITEMDDSSAVALLKRMCNFDNNKLSPDELRGEEAAAKQIVQRVGCYPLALSQAANLIMNDGCFLSEFLEGYNNEDLIKDSQNISSPGTVRSQYHHSLGTVWDMNFNRLSTNEQRLLYILSYMDPDRLQLRIISEGAVGSNDESLDFVNTPRKIYKAKTALLHSSLVRQNANLRLSKPQSGTEELREVSMHRLVQASCHIRMSPATRRDHFKIAVTMIKRCWPVASRHATYNPAFWSDQRMFLPHIQSLCHFYNESCGEDEPLIPHEEANWDFPRLLYEASWYAWLLYSLKHKVSNNLGTVTSEECTKLCLDFWIQPKTTAYATWKG